jgi:hypothetical protein
MIERKFIKQKPERKQEQITDLKDLPQDQEIAKKTFQEKINQNLKRVFNKTKNLLEEIVGPSREKLLKIFKQGGFDEKIELIKKQISELEEKTKRKIESLESLTDVLDNFDDVLDDFDKDLESIEKQISDLEKEIKKEVEFFDIYDQEQYEKESYEQLVERIANALQSLEEQKDQIEKIGLLSKVGILADSRYIENQQIDIIKTTDNEYKLYFKLTEEHYKKILNKYSENEKTSLVYKDNKDNNKRFLVSEALKKEINGVIIKIANGIKFGDKTLSALGLVEITIQQNNNTQLTPQEITQKINKILTEELEIESGLYLPTKEAELQYKIARYKWHHKTKEVPSDIDKRLKRKEVAPGYFTFVEEGKHKEYQKISRYAIYHFIYSIDNLPQIIQAGGLLSSHERYHRGLLIHGSSTGIDFSTGGADSVFTTIITEDKAKIENLPLIKSIIVFDPSLLDRTDWYTYDRDRYGSTNPDVFNDRLNPEELLNKINQLKCTGSEQMFRCGISIDKFKAIVCPYEDEAIKIGNYLHKAGITEINGQSVDDMIIIAKKLIDLIDISEGKLENVKTVRSLLEKQ